MVACYRPAMAANETETRLSQTGEVGTEWLFAEIEALARANRSRRDLDRERRLLQLRHLAGISLRGGGSSPEHPEPDLTGLPEDQRVPDIRAADVTPGLLRAGILRDGCLLVRGLVDRVTALRFADQIERAFEERERNRSEAVEGYYEEFEPEPPFRAPHREWIKEGGGLLAADSPQLNFEMMEMFEQASVPELVADYLGEPAAMSLNKTTLRKAEPSVVGAWHQDGAFMGDVRSINLWLSLSRCGDEAPGLEIVPRRLDHLVETGGEGTMIANQVSEATAEKAAGEIGTVRPIFEPGDAMFFDELFLHQTGSDPSMPNPRYAIESWFFAASAFPGDYAPIAV